MLKIRIYGNQYYSNRRNYHVQVPKRYGFPDNCLVLTVEVRSNYVLLHDNCEIFKSINQSRSRVNRPIYCHGLNRYAINHHNNLQILAGVDLANIIYTSHPTKKQMQSAIMDYIKFIQKINQAGIDFKYVY